MSKSIVWVKLPRRRPEGHEQHGCRPCILVFDPSPLQETRFPMVLVVPVTASFDSEPPLYLSLPAGAGGLREDSTVLLDQFGFVDASRVVGFVGTLTDAEYLPIQEGLRRMLEA